MPTPNTTLTLTGASNGGNIGTIGGDLTLCDCFGGGLTINGGALTVNGPSGVGLFGGTLSVINGATLQDQFGSRGVERRGGLRTRLVGRHRLHGRRRLRAAQLLISNGATMNSLSGAEIDAVVAGASVTVTGAGSTWTIGGIGLQVGTGFTGGPGMLTVASGGQVTATAVIVGDISDGSST